MARGRRSKFTEEQWREIEKRHLGGETIRSIAREFGVSESTIRERISAQAREIKSVANQIVETEKRLEALPISAQISAQTLAAQIRAMNDSLAAAGVHGAATTLRLMALANQEVQKLDDVNPLGNADALKGVALLSMTANHASRVPLALMAAAARASDPTDPEPPGLTDPNPDV
jgi:transposase-like protein